MNICLIYPPYKKEEIYSYLAQSAPVLPPLGLAYLASYLRKFGYELKIIDAPTLNIEIKDIIKILTSYEPRLIGITANSPLYSKVLLLAKDIKEKFPEAKIVLGGYHPTFLPKDILKNYFIDFVVRGEGEQTLLQLCEMLNAGKEDFFSIDGLGFKCKEKIVLNKERTFLQNLDTLPFPAYDLLPLDRYHTGVNIRKTRNEISIIASRGCLGNCYFCTSPGFWNNIHRKHSPKYIVDLMNYLFERFRKNCFQFRDDTFTLDRKWVMEFCSLLRHNKNEYQWDCYARFDTLNEDLLRTMRRAGCYQISLGVESANESILWRVKHLSKEKITEGMRLLNKCKFRTRLFFMVGPPAENNKDIDDIADFAINLDPGIITVTATIPYPGSFFWSSFLNNGKHLPFDKEVPRVYEGFCDFENFSRDYIKDKVAQIYRKFYFRPKYILSQLLSIKNFNDIYNIIIGGMSMVKMVERIYFTFIRRCTFFIPRPFVIKKLFYKKMKFAHDSLLYFQILRFTDFIANLQRYKKFFKFIKRKPLLLLRVVHIFVSSIFVRKQALRKLELAVTYDCQCSCDKCSSYKLKNETFTPLKIEEIKGIARQAYLLGGFQVNFIGGEPLLRKDLLQVIKCFNPQKTFLSISTNGALLDKDKVKELRKAGIDYIKISLDSPVEVEHDISRGLKGLFSNILKAVEHIKKEGLLCELSTVVTKESIRTGKIWELVKFAKEKNVILGLNIPAACGKWSKRYDVLLDDNELGIVKKLMKYPHVIRDIQTGLFRAQCCAAKEQIYITAYGEVLPCSVIHISFGNIREEKIEEIWKAMKNSNMFSKSKDLCLAGEDSVFIKQYLDPITSYSKVSCLLKE